MLGLKLFAVVFLCQKISEGLSENLQCNFKPSHELHLCKNSFARLKSLAYFNVYNNLVQAHPKMSHKRSNKLSEVNDVESAVKRAKFEHHKKNDVTFAKKIKSSKDAAKSHKKEVRSNVNDASAYDASANDASAYDASANDASAYDASADDASAYDASAYDASAYDASADDASAYDASAYDASAYDASAYDASAHDASADDASASAYDAYAYENLKNGKGNRKDSKHYIKKLKHYAKDFKTAIKHLKDAFSDVNAKNDNSKQKRKPEQKRGMHFHSE